MGQEGAELAALWLPPHLAAPSSKRGRAGKNGPPPAILCNRSWQIKLAKSVRLFAKPMPTLGRQTLLSGQKFVARLALQWC